MRSQKEVEYYYSLLEEASKKTEIPEYFQGHFDILLWFLDNEKYNNSSIKEKMEEIIKSY